MVLYIAKRGPYNIGTKLHLQAVRDTYGEANVFVVDLLSRECCEKDRFISFGYDRKNFWARIVRYLEGNINFISNSIISKLCEIISDNNITIIFSEESDLGNLFKKVKKLFLQVEIVCFFHDISADLFRRRISHTSKWKLHYILECKRVISQEKTCQKYADQKWVFNEEDSKRFFNYYGYYPDKMIPLSSTPPVCDNKYQSIITGEKSRKNILFVCSKYYVNIEGFTWFYNNVLPSLDKIYHIQIVGEGAKQLSSLIKVDDVEVIGEVETITPYYENADIVIAPVFDGGGMKVKTIEAISFAKCIISTSESLNGYWEVVPDNIKNNLIYRCNTAEEWIEACNALINRSVKKYNEEIFDMFEKYFAYDVMLAEFHSSLPRNT